MHAYAAEKDQRISAFAISPDGAELLAALCAANGAGELCLTTIDPSAGKMTICKTFLQPQPHAAYKCYCMSERHSIVTAMTPFPHTAEVDQSLAAAQAIMIEHDFHHLPVTRDGNLAGVLSARAVELAFALTSDAEKQKLLKVSDVYFKDPFTVETTADLGMVAAEMARRRLDAALVLKHGKLVGIFTLNDACRALAQQLGAKSGPPDEIA